VKSKGTKGRERVVGKAAGDECVFIPGEGPGWQMRSGATMPDAAPLARCMAYNPPGHTLAAEIIARHSDACPILDWGTRAPPSLLC
jgi:hypothetical protein